MLVVYSPPPPERLPLLHLLPLLPPPRLLEAPLLPPRLPAVGTVTKLFCPAGCGTLHAVAQQLTTLVAFMKPPTVLVQQALGFSAHPCCVQSQWSCSDKEHCWPAW
jgi:hypothetical protein